MIGLVDGNNFYVSCERVLNRKLVGKPVAVLSNNDGCCVALSPEFKALGIPRGTPYFQLKDRESRREGDGGLIFLSSNYELYGDMSRRIVSILREEALDVEQYSIDEAFIVPPVDAVSHRVPVDAVSHRVPVDAVSHRVERGQYHPFLTRRDSASTGLRSSASTGLRSSASTGLRSSASTGLRTSASTGLRTSASTGLRSSASTGLYEYGVALRKKLYRWTGIPCGVGFARTKTLAKIANHIGKKRPDGVFVMPDDATEILSNLPVGEVWGVGRRLPVKLRAERIVSAQDLSGAPDDLIRSIGGITLLRTATELRGTPCNEERDYEADPDSVSCSRSFGEPITTLEALSESLASFTAQAAVKLRKHELLASGCNIYAQYGTACENDYTARTVVFPAPTDATNEMLQAISKEVPALFLAGARYRKSGLVFFGLEKAGTARQLDLFESTKPLERSKLYEVIDRMNRQYGKGSVLSASEGLASRRPLWTMRRDKLSGLSTTDWSHLPIAR